MKEIIIWYILFDIYYTISKEDEKEIRMLVFDKSVTLFDKLKEYDKEEKKIYPNDPCPCGSGKKYKKCCGK